MYHNDSITINSRGHLVFGGCDTVELARTYKTPLYVMDEVAIRRAARHLRSALEDVYPDAEVIYASKAFCTVAMCRLVDEEGLSLDVSSGGELYTALVAGFPPEKIYFHGNNKSPEEIEMGLKAGIGRFMVDNLFELELINQLAGRLKKKADIILRITPGVEAHTHDYIRTGQIDSKFGIGITGGQAQRAVEKALAMDNVELRGFHCHIGSQIQEIEPYVLSAGIMMDFISDVRESTGFTASELDLGGGIGIRYVESDARMDLPSLFAAISKTIADKAERHGIPLPRLLIEPGRYIVGEAGITLYTVGAVKDIPGVRTYVAVDGGMADNPRVALYRAQYEAVVANKANLRPTAVVSIAGKACESGDMLIWDIELPRVEPGDIIAVLSTGAYTYSMASNYNRFPRPACVFVSEGEAYCVVERETYEDIIAKDRLPGAIGQARPSAAAL
ncbi:MAG TPA: diaminopimelate decarboxylase [Firmicutes bacterium]|nr:diaminopimelate decarboxylase [Bacillota bacterium]